MDRKLEEPAFARIQALLEDYGDPPAAFRVLSRVTMQPDSAADVARLSGRISSEGRNEVERTLLLLASRHAISLAPALPVNDSVKKLFAKEFQFFADPPPAWIPNFGAHHVRFREMARIATLRRFPAGQFHWEISVLPRSWALKSMLFVLARMRGFGPLFELHINERRKNRLILLEKEADLSYYRAARSMEMQPGIKGLITASWLYSESTGRVSPHLAWMRQSLLSAGARIFDIGPADPDSGFQVGSEERRDLYQKGEYRPTHACVLWDRRSLISWARQRPQLDAE